MLAVFLPLIMLSIKGLAVRMGKLHTRPFLNLNWLSDVTKKGSNLLIMQCSKTFDTTGLMAMPLKSSQVRTLL